MLLPVTHVLPLTTIERRRMLPVAGTVLVRSGQEVGASDVIATADVFAEHISLDLARGLGVPKAQVAELMQRKIGDKVAKGAVIASRPGVVSRVVRSPKAGKLVAVGGGQALLQVSRKPFELRAGIPGRIFKVEPDYGAIIRMTGSWIEGVWGNGRLGVGGLYVAASTPDHVLSARDLDPSRRGQIVLAGHCAEADVLETVLQLKMRGLVLGSLTTRLRPMAAQMPYPIMVLEGFGNIPINSIAYRLLSTSAEREITLNAAQFNRSTGDRPEIVIPASSDIDAPMPMQMVNLDIGNQVRILRDPYMGMVGSVTGLLGVRRLENGLHAETAEVTLDTEANTNDDEPVLEEKVVVPLANLEIIG